MLQMKCPECEEIISSPFLIEIGSISCNQCKEDVAVRDVFVKTKLFTMHRDTLLKRVRHYRALLNEVESEKVLLEKSDGSSMADPKSLNQYYYALRELLEASRGNYRLKISQNLPLDIEQAGVTSNGWLINLSSKGAAIKTGNRHNVPKQGAEVKLRLSLPVNTEPLSITAKISWTGKSEKGEGQNNTTMGISFTEEHGKSQSYIWDYIVGTVEKSKKFGEPNPSLAIS